MIRMIIASLFALLFAISIGMNVASANSVHDYLDEKLKQSKVEIAKIHIQDQPPVEIKSYELQSDKLWERDIGGNPVFVTNMLNMVLVLARNQVLLLNEVPLLNETSELREVPRIPRDSTVKFIRSIVWKSVMYLLICYEFNSCSLYTAGNNVEFKHRQTIRHRGFPVDATFFIRDNQLYLVVADNSGQFTVPSVIYEWRGTYMDMVTEMFTTGAVSVTSFKHKQSTIIIFAQNDKNIPGIGSLVYEFKGNRVERIQFLPTLSPVSVHQYTYGDFNFVLFVNENSPSDLFWWDGQELLSWSELPEVKSPGLSRIVNIENETFFFSSEDNIVKLYKVQSASDCILVGTLKLEDNEIPVDLRVQTNDSSIIAVLVVKDTDDRYGIETWELHIKEASHDSSVKETDVPSKCLADLIEILSRRMPSVQKASSSWQKLYAFDEDLAIIEPIKIPDLIFESGSINRIELITPAEIVPPNKLHEEISDLLVDVEKALNISRGIITTNRTIYLTGNVVVEDDAFSEEMEIDSLSTDFWNGNDLRRSGTPSARSTEQSSDPMRGKTIVVENLEVDSLCGLPSRYWARKDDSTTLELNMTDSRIQIHNDTLFLNMDISMPILNVDTINSVHMDKFLSEIFIYGSNKSIAGNITYMNSVKILNLKTETLNEIPADKLLDKKSNQSFDSFFIRTLEIDRLYADSVNNVLVNESARTTRENEIKGEVSIASLHITEELTVGPESDLGERKFLQVYQNVTIEGKVTIKKIELQKSAEVFLNDEKIDLDEIFEKYWTKSSNQVIENEVTFENDFTIDRLNADYINGFAKDEYLYTTSKEIPEGFGQLHFTDFEIENSFVLEDENLTLINLTYSDLSLRREWHIGRLLVKNLYVDTFNNIPMDHLLNNNQSLNFTTSIISYPTIRAKRIKTAKIHFDLINNKTLTELLNSNEDREVRKVGFMRAKELNVEEIIVNRINNFDVKNLGSLENVAEYCLKNLIVEGDVTVKNDLKVTRIDNQSPEEYLEEMGKNIVIWSEELLDNLTVETVIVNFLHGRNATTFFQDFLSRTKEQGIPGNFSFHRITTNDIETSFINDQDVSQLIWIDAPFTVVGNITFANLHVEGDIITTKLNEHDPHELYNNLLSVPLKNISYLEIDGEISWENSWKPDNSLTVLLENAVTKDTEQIINGIVVFANPVRISNLTGNFSEEAEIREIISDAVLNDGTPIKISGEKIFKGNLTVKDLSVSGNIDISQINHVNILDFNNSVIKKYEANEITNPVTFLNEVIINEFYVNGTIHGAPISGIALSTEVLPSNLVFKRIHVLGNVHLENLDGIAFDNFINTRITLDGDHEIYSNIQFNNLVEVTERANVSKINDIEPSDFVLNGVENPQFISGMKTFEDDVVITGNIQAPIINNINISSEYNDAIMKNDDVEIFGDLIFEAGPTINDVAVSQLVNGVNLSSLLSESLNKDRYNEESLQQQRISIQEKIVELTKISNTLPSVFMYLETEESLKIRLPNIKQADVMYFGNVVKLNLYGEEPGYACGLPQNCSCPLQYTLEYVEDECNLQKINDFTTLWYFHDINSGCGIKVQTNVVSSSPECTLMKNRKEYTTISWMKVQQEDVVEKIENVQSVSLKIDGLIKDVQFFAEKNEIFIFLAVYYNTISKTHRTNSIVYKLNLATNALSLHREIPTNGAWDLEVFYIDSSWYLLIGCIEPSAKSFLYTFDSNSSKFLLLREFASRSRNVKYFSQDNYQFILLDDLNTNAVNIFYYSHKFHNFYSYQSFFYDARVNSIERIYLGEFAHSDSFIIVTTEDDQFFLNEYMFADGFQQVSHSWINNLQTMLPFHLSGEKYIFAGTSTNSTILRIVQEGPHA